MLAQLYHLAELLKRVPQGPGLPQPDLELLDDVMDSLEDVYQDEDILEAEVGALSRANPSDPEEIVPAMVQLHVRLDEISVMISDLHGELKRLIVEYPQIEED